MIPATVFVGDLHTLKQRDHCGVAGRLHTVGSNYILHRGGVHCMSHCGGASGQHTVGSTLYVILS